MLIGFSLLVIAFSTTQHLLAALLGMWPLGTLPLTWAADRFSPGAATAFGSSIAGLFGLAVMAMSRRSLRAVRAD